MASIAARSPAARISRLWAQLSPLPGGTWAFSRVLGWMVPYSGSIRPHVRELRPGYARISMGDRRAVRNHLNSIHAIALVNLGEVTSGLAMITALPPEVRSIVTGLSMQFLKKARGVLVAECHCEVPGQLTEPAEQVVLAEITDQHGDVVARASVTWLLSPPS
ncbi:MAG: hotdog fold domain-containing protein [Gemmatimonadota bacterium]